MSKETGDIINACLNMALVLVWGAGFLLMYRNNARR